MNNLEKTTLIILFPVALITASYYFGSYMNGLLRYDRSDQELNVLVDKCNELGGRAGVYKTDRSVHCSVDKWMRVGEY